MSNSDLLAVLSRLPERCLEQAIMDCVERRVSAGEYELADSMIRHVLRILENRPALSASLAALGVKIAIRSRDLELAICRYGQISDYGHSEAIINLRSDALYYLAEGLLPEWPGRLFDLWLAALSEALPAHARFNLRSLGQLLDRHFARIGNGEMGRRIGCALEAIKMAVD